MPYKQLFTACLLIPLLSLFTASAAERPKNIIMVVGDGMGPAYTAAYRYYMDNPATPQVETTIFDELLVGMASTWSAGTQSNHTDKTYVTDSAAAATALSTGVKTYNQAVAVDVNDKPLQTLMEYAKAQGKTTGLVVTSQINHATPAAYVAHNTYRYNYDAIADNYFENRVNGRPVADLMFGGGQKYFIREDRNIVEQFQGIGYHYADTLEALTAIERLPALALVADSSLEYALDSEPQYRLRTMTEKALKLVNNNPKGFFLLVEGSMIDWCGHDNDIACTMAEMDDFAKTLQMLKGWVEQHPDTLMVATADHDTGGLSVGANGEYRWKRDLVKQIKGTIHGASLRLLKDEPMRKVWSEEINLPLNKNDAADVSKAQKQALHAINQTKDPLFNQGMSQDKLNEIITDARLDLERTMSRVIGDQTGTGWTSTAHTGVDVQVFATGSQSNQFVGHQDNTDIAKKLFKLMGRKD